MSVSVLEDKWTAEEFSAELEKMKSRDSEYSHTLQNSKEVAQKVEDSMLIYQIMGHEQDCSALTYGKYYFIGCKVGREYVEIQSPFEKVEEAATYLDSHLEL